ncbi:hypothetical protein PM082_023957 [Marasmius tenuissimus]|nr:hypothetical protein PM082_023957 [Marasmius tenuissimus]
MPHHSRRKAQAATQAQDAQLPFHVSPHQTFAAVTQGQSVPMNQPPQIPTSVYPPFFQPAPFVPVTMRAPIPVSTSPVRSRASASPPVWYSSRAQENPSVSLGSVSPSSSSSYPSVSPQQRGSTPFVLRLQAGLTTSQMAARASHSPTSSSATPRPADQHGPGQNLYCPRHASAFPPGMSLSHHPPTQPHRNPIYSRHNPNQPPPIQSPQSPVQS